MTQPNPYRNKVLLEAERLLDTALSIKGDRYSTSEDLAHAQELIVQSKAMASEEHRRTQTPAHLAFLQWHDLRDITDPTPAQAERMAYLEAEIVRLDGHPPRHWTDPDDPF